MRTLLLFLSCALAQAQIVDIVGSQTVASARPILNANFHYLDNAKLVNPMTTTGDLIYRSSTGTTRLGIGSSGQCLTVSAGVPAWTTCTSAVTSVFTRSGAVVAVSGDYTAAQVTNAFDVTANNTLGAHSQDVTDISTPAAPAAGHTKIYTKGGKICSEDSSASENCTGGACGTCIVASSPGAGVLHVAGGTQTATSSAVVSADLNITTTNCTAPQILTAIGATGLGTCTAPLLTQNSQSAAYTTVLGDAGKQIYHPSADTTARTWTIDSNANVAYAIGTCITFINDTSGGVITISITSDTLVLAGTGTTGSRTLAANGIATACKLTSTRWLINGTGLT